jgi:hypothetical protein
LRDQPWPGCSGCDTDRVLDLIAGQAELPGDRVDRLACPEQVDHVVNGGAAAGESRTSEAVVGVDGHVREGVLGQADQLRVAVCREVDAPQVEIDDLGEDTLVVADDDKFPRGVRLQGVARVLGVVLQDLGAVGVQAAAREPWAALGIARATCGSSRKWLPRR